MKKIKANTVLSTFIFGVSILMLCSFGTDSAYIILSRYKLQKIANALALEYAASLSRNAEYSYASRGDCGGVAQKFLRIYNAMGSGTLVFRIQSMNEKTDEANKESVVKVQVSSKIMPAFLRFVGAREIHVYANAYAKTNVIENEISLPAVPAGEEYGNIENFTYVTLAAPYVQGGKTADIVTNKAGLNGDFAINLKYIPSDGSAPDGVGSGFFVFAGYGTTPENARWVDVGTKVKKANPTDPDPWTEVCNNNEKCFYCVNASNPDFTPKTVTFDLSQNDEAITGGVINRFNYLRIYKAGAIAGSSLRGGTVTNPCDPSILTGGSAEGAATIANAIPVFNFGEKNKIGTTKRVMFAATEDAGNSGGGDDDIFSNDADVSSSSETIENPVLPNIYNTDATLKFSILNNVSLINAREYREFTGAAETNCVITPSAPPPTPPAPPTPPSR